MDLDIGLIEIDVFLLDDGRGPYSSSRPDGRLFWRLHFTLVDRLPGVRHWRSRRPDARRNSRAVLSLQGGRRFRYVADLFIGPRTADNSGARGKNAERVPPFATLPGDSGTMWMLEPTAAGKNGHPQGGRDSQDYLPLAVQWGRNMLYSADRTRPQSYVLATLLSKVCALLEVDPVRDWNIDQDDTWGALGHFSIAARALLYLSGRFPKLGKLWPTTR